MLDASLREMLKIEDMPFGVYGRKIFGTFPG